MKAIRNIFAVLMILAAGFAYAGAPMGDQGAPTDGVFHCPPQC